MVPLSEINPSDLGSIKKSATPATQAAASTTPRSGQNLKRSTSTSGILLDDTGGGSTGLPPRPKKRKPLGMHR